jgi:hypothetical protein
VPACGGRIDSATTDATVPPKPANRQSPMVGVAKTGLGKVLGDSPLRLTGKATAGMGLTHAELGTIARSARRRQVSCNGHVLYLFAGDQRPR